MKNSKLYRNVLFLIALGIPVMLMPGCEKELIDLQECQPVRSDSTFFTVETDGKKQIEKLDFQLMPYQTQLRRRAFQKADGILVVSVVEVIELPKDTI